jgi:hypothetical protein
VVLPANDVPDPRQQVSSVAQPAPVLLPAVVGCGQMSPHSMHRPLLATILDQSSLQALQAWGPSCIDARLFAERAAEVQTWIALLERRRRTSAVA